MFQFAIERELFRFAIRRPAIVPLFKLPSDRNSQDTVNPYTISVVLIFTVT